MVKVAQIHNIERGQVDKVIKKAEQNIQRAFRLGIQHERTVFMLSSDGLRRPHLSYCINWAYFIFIR